MISSKLTDGCRWADKFVERLHQAILEKFAVSNNYYSELLSQQQPSEAWVRQVLARLETDFREFALHTLAEWDNLGVVAPEMFGALAALQRPAWGHWNGLLTALRDARKTLLRTGSPAERDKIKQADHFNARFEMLDETCSAEVGHSLKPLSEL